ncbi:SHC-transforming protein 1-like isoform X1 [Haliotis rufescens]|uniref:SHC-transforming protein 1-like isoform X1 n=2 Tax=Haliotis rufescens TaxID=6454 RepID=UPI00201F8FF3|nr:SHC-transforming protein 1-like isoform X1 [Haliotis rufescens]
MGFTKHCCKSKAGMAGVIDKLRKKNKVPASEWSRTGSFLNKPEIGWIHPDQQLEPDAGICYGVRYIGCIEVKESMKSLDFETRTTLTREAINRVTEAAGLKTASKKRKVEKKIQKMIGDNPYMQYAGSNVNLTITVESINLMVMESGEIIADHPMQVVSFASGGDAETLDFVAYVAKDPQKGRACHVLECGGGLAEDVVTTVGQAFELRFKQYLKKQPKAVRLPDRQENPSFDNSKWGDEEEYYNDHPGACPPSPPIPEVPPVPEYKSPTNVPVGLYASVKDRKENGLHEGQLIDLRDATYDNTGAASASDRMFDDTVYDNKENGIIYDNKDNVMEEMIEGGKAADPFNLGQFDSNLPKSPVTDNVPASGAMKPSGGAVNSPPIFEEWFHGNIGRKQAEDRLEHDGDFLVRESSNSPGQYVLSGRQNGQVKHLLLVDPEGVVRTKDFIFDSVTHLITYHRQNNLPIVTQGSELLLVRPIKNSISAI